MVQQALHRVYHTKDAIQESPHLEQPKCFKAIQHIRRMKRHNGAKYTDLLSNHSCQGASANNQKTDQITGPKATQYMRKNRHWKGPTRYTETSSK